MLEDLVGAENVVQDADPTMGGEDFAFLAEARPGAFVFIGNGDTARLHTATYDFNDELIPWGVSYWATLVREQLPTAG